MTDPKNITVHYRCQMRSMKDVQMVHPHFCALVDGTPLPESISDIFTAEVRREGDAVRVVVDFA